MIVRLFAALLTFFGWHVSCRDSYAVQETNISSTDVYNRRSLQFDGMFIGDNFQFYNQNPRGKGKKGQRVVNPARLRASNLKKAVADILAGKLICIYLHTVFKFMISSLAHEKVWINTTNGGLAMRIRCLHLR